MVACELRSLDSMAQEISSRSCVPDKQFDELKELRSCNPAYYGRDSLGVELLSSSWF